MAKIELKREPKLTAKYASFPYQHEAFVAIRDLEYGAILHEQGLGKTKIAIDLLLYWLQEKVVDTVVIAVKKSLVSNWLEELESHSSIKPRVLSSNRRENFYILNSPVRLILVNYEVIKAERERFCLFCKTRDVGIILDEATKIKNPGAEVTQAFFELAPLFKRRIIMTGTPVSNRPYDIWAPVWFLDQGESLGNNYAAFVRETNLDNDLYEDIDRQYALGRRLDDIFDRISAFSVRETKNSGVISLPDKLIETVTSYWETRQREIYDQIRQELRLVVLKDGKPTEDLSENVLKRLLRLVQVASNPRLIDAGYTLEPGKLEDLHELLSTISLKGEKTIVWTIFNENIKWLAQELISYKPAQIFGKMDMAQRDANIARFKTDPETRVLLATPGAGKEGLTLTVANHAIFYDRGFSLDDYLQAQDRVHRISQTRTCHIYNLVMQGSIDEWIDQLLAAKHIAAQLAQGDIDINTFREKMSYAYGELLREILEEGSGRT